MVSVSSSASVLVGLWMSLSVAACARVTHPGTAPAPDALLDPTAAFWSARAPDTYRVRVTTSRGRFVIAVTRAWSSRGADRFYNLVRAGFFDDSRFYRVVPGFIAQFGIAGDPRVARVWADRSFADDAPVAPDVRGSVAFAMTGPNARTTQVFINLADNRRLDAQGFAPFGRVVEGMAVVDSLYAGYGERSGGGMRAGRQAPLIDGGNSYVDATYPRLDRLVKAEVIPPVY